MTLTALAFFVFSRQQQDTLTHHIAKKMIPCVDDATGAATKRQGMKLELFIFDILCFSGSVQAYYCERSREFSPLKVGCVCERVWEVCVCFLTKRAMASVILLAIPVPNQVTSSSVLTK